MPSPNFVVDRLQQVERELTAALSEYPSDIAVDRLKFTRSLVRFVRTQLEMDDDATIPVLNDVDNKPAANGTE